MSDDLNADIVSYYKYHHPAEVAGMQDQEILDGMKAVDPNFGQVAWGVQHPVLAAVNRLSDSEVAHPGIPAKVAGAIYGAVNDVGTAITNQLPKPVSDALAKPFNMAQEGYKDIGDLADAAYDKNYQMVGDALNYTSGIGQVLSPKGISDFVVAKALDATPAVKSAIGDKLTSLKDHIGKSLTATGAEDISGEIKEPISVQSADNINKSLGVKVPEYHGAIGKDVLSSAKSTLKEAKNDAYSDLENVTEKNPAMGNTKLSETNKDGEITNNLYDAVTKLYLKNAQLPEELQEPVLKKLVSALNPEPSESPSPVQPAPLDPTYTATEAVPLRKRLSEIYGRHTTFNPITEQKVTDSVGYQAKLLMGAVDKDIAEYAPKPVADAHQNALDKASEYYKKFGMGTVANKALNTSDELFHKVVTRDLDSVQAIKDAGGSAVTKQAKMSHAYELVNKLTNGARGMSGDAIRAEFAKDRVADSLFTNKEIESLADTADARQKALSTNKVSESSANELQGAPLVKSVPEKLMAIAKNHAGLAGGAALGSVVPGVGTAAGGLLGELLDEYVKNNKAK